MNPPGPLSPPNPPGADSEVHLYVAGRTRRPIPQCLSQAPADRASPDPDHDPGPGPGPGADLEPRPAPGPASRLDFYLGSHHPSWLESMPVHVPLMISHARLRGRVRLPAARGRWALDSGAYTEITRHGSWRDSPGLYADRVLRYQAEIGHLDFAATQDWPCEPQAIRASGLSVPEHQERSVASYLYLANHAPTIPWLPILQGWSIGDYLHCARLYAQAGVDLGMKPLVGVGSVCRRSNIVVTALIFDRIIADAGVTRLHGFGLKTQAVGLFGDRITSCDSLAWSESARHEPPFPGHQHLHCNNCLVLSGCGGVANRIAAAHRLSSVREYEGHVSHGAAGCRRAAPV